MSESMQSHDATINEKYNEDYYQTNEQSQSNSQPIWSPSITAAAHFLIAPHPLEHTIHLEQSNTPSLDQSISPSASSYSTQSLELSPINPSLSEEQPANSPLNQSERVAQLINTYSQSLIESAVRDKAYADLSRIDEIFSSAAEQANLTKLQRWKLSLRRQRLQIMLQYSNEQGEEHVDPAYEGQHLDDEENNETHDQANERMEQLLQYSAGYQLHNLSPRSVNQTTYQPTTQTTYQPINLPMAPPAFVRAYSESDEAGIVLPDQSPKRHLAFSFLRRSPSAPPETHYQIQQTNRNESHDELSDSASSISTGEDNQSNNQAHNQSLSRSSSHSKRARDDILLTPSSNQSSTLSNRPSGLPPRPTSNSKRSRFETTQSTNQLNNSLGRSRTTRSTASLLMDQPSRINQSINQLANQSPARSWERSSHSDSEEESDDESDTDDEKNL